MSTLSSTDICFTLSPLSLCVLFHCSIKGFISATKIVSQRLMQLFTLLVWKMKDAKWFEQCRHSWALFYWKWCSLSLFLSTVFAKLTLMDKVKASFSITEYSDNGNSMVILSSRWCRHCKHKQLPISGTLCSIAQSSSSDLFQWHCAHDWSSAKAAFHLSIVFQLSFFPPLRPF